MKACQKCGNWHLQAEKVAGHRLSCDQVKKHWAAVKRKHYESYGHRAQPVTNPAGWYVCATCGRPL
ncbi:MAG: hypothetical protein KQJ78_15645 [Deltaproteobacteria bacterium]|nr:hypothetical protein [Deltaproteobacteria bacterium]